MVCGPELGGDEDIFTFDTCLKCLLQSDANFFFVPVAVRCINMAVTN
jgi:hypothetical protein